MLHMFSQRLNTIKKTGLKAGLPEEEARKVMVVNAFSFLTALLCTFCGVTLALASGDDSIFYTAMGFVGGFLSVIWLNSRYRFQSAKLGLQVVFCCVMLYYGCTFGESTQVHFLGLFLIGVPLLICSRRELLLRCVCLILPLATLCLLETNYYYSLVTPMDLDRGTLYFFRWLIMAVVLLLNYMVISFYQDNINGLLDKLRLRHDSLKRRSAQILQKEAEVMEANRRLENYNEKLRADVQFQTKQLLNHNVMQQEIMTSLEEQAAEARRSEQRLARLVEELMSTKTELTSARDEAERANAAKSAFLRELSHEIRNPLNAILGICYLLQQDDHNRQQTSAGIMPYIDSIGSSGHIILEIINSVLELARIEAGKTDEIRQESFSLREWAQTLLNVYQPSAQVKEVQLQLEIDPQLPPYIMGDRMHLTQVLGNLLANAIKFTPSGKNVKLSCFQREPDMWYARVTDEGMGIPADKQALIFQPYEQADDAIHQQYGGTGLGLTIAKRLAELLGGNIDVWSEPGKGTSFTVSLPLQAAPVMVASGEIGEAGLSTCKRLRRMQVLLMEDSPVNRMIMQEFFQYLGVSFLMTDNGEDGLELVRSQRPDLVILDMHMPRLNGRQVIHAIRDDEQLKDIPIIVLSADAFREQRESALREGVNEYLIKPVQFSELRAVLEKYIDAPLLADVLAHELPPSPVAY
ncbi:ATP-binding response regulator [Chitinophaga lutea]